MVKESIVTRRFKLVFPSDSLGEPFIYKLSRNMDVIPNIIRGRVTDKEAWLEVDVQGKEKHINKAMEFLRERGVAVKQVKSKR